jgi:hypothetical protein
MPSSFVTADFSKSMPFWSFCPYLPLPEALTSKASETTIDMVDIPVYVFLPCFLIIDVLFSP